MLSCICAASPSNRRPQPIANRVSPTNDDLLGGQMKGDMAGGMGGDVDQLGLDLADPRAVAAGDDAVHLRHPLGLGRAGDRAAGRGADRVVAAGMIGMPVGVPDLADPPAARRRRLEHRIGDRRIDRHRLARGGIVDQPDIIVAEDRDGDDLEHHQCPAFGIDAQGSATGRLPPFCSSSTEMPSGVRTNAIRPSRGGRLMVTPPSISRRQVS